MGDLQDNGLNRKIVDAASIAKDVDLLEAEIAELRHTYEQFFLGLERKPPTFQHAELKKRIFRMKGAFVRQTALKFKINGLQQKFTSYERLWSRTLQEIENGTYRRDLFKAKLHKKEQEEKQGDKKHDEPKRKEAHDLDDALADLEIVAEVDEIVPAPAPAPVAKQPSAPAVAPVAKPLSAPAIAPVARPASAPAIAPVARPVTGATPAAAKPVTGSTPAAKPVTGSTPAVARPTTGATPAAAKPVTGSTPAARPPTPAGGNAQLSDAKLRQVYDAYLTAKKKSGEDTSKLSYEQVATNLRKQVPELMKKSGASSVEFKIVIKDGKAVLRAIPK